MPLTTFQRRKLATMFAALDLDRDGVLELHDYTRRVGAVAKLKGWMPDSPLYARNFAFALAQWGNLAEYADSNVDSRVTLAEFLRYGEQYLSDPAAAHDYAKGDIQLIFDAMDADGDGRLTVAEYRAYLRACGADDAIAQAFFAHVDLDEDGRITREELARAVEDFLLSQNPDAAGNYLFGPIVPEPA